MQYSFYRLSNLFFLFSIVKTLLFAEQLPIKQYTTADGLARDFVGKIVQDSRGFIWFCTSEGLSRFDGYTFYNYTTKNGLPHRFISDVLESRDGKYWVATAGGLCEFFPKGISGSGDSIQFFSLYHLNKNKSALGVNALIEDSDGRIWCATTDGLYILDVHGGNYVSERIDFGKQIRSTGSNVILTLMFDTYDDLWIGTEDGLYCRRNNGQFELYTMKDGLPSSGIKTIIEDDRENIWVGTPGGACYLSSKNKVERYRVQKVFTTKNGLRNQWVNALYLSQRDMLWVGTTYGLSRIEFVEGIPTIIKTYTKADGLTDYGVSAITEDKTGNLWLGTESGGVMKLALNGFTTYNVSDGLSSDRIGSIFEDNKKELCVIAGGNYFAISTFNATQFNQIKVKLPQSIKDIGWGWNQIHFQDHRGEWWIQSAHGLLRYPKVDSIEQLATRSPLKRYTTKDGLGGNVIFRLYEDNTGDIWISTLDNIEGTLTRWERATNSFHQFPLQKEFYNAAPTAFCEDSSGNLWIGSYEGSLARVKNDVFEFFPSQFGASEGLIRALYIDSKRRLWIATSFGGVKRLDDVTTSHPLFINYTTSEGLSSNDARCITEDRWGRIYIGTGKGVDRLNVETGQIKHYSVADGLGSNSLNVAFRDKNNILWFGTLQGLSRLDPVKEVEVRVPTIFFTALTIAGVRHAISELGENELSGFELRQGENNIAIEFSSIGFGIGEVLRYQYKLDGGETEWSVPTTQRAVNYASLAPGTYRFQVSALNTDGLMSEHPATISFVILPPFWQRWWFLLLILIAVGSVLYSVYRIRVHRILEMENLRRRIARDLHDDIGADLTQIAIFSEVIKTRIRDAETESMLEKIGTMARRVIGGMSELVWYIDPRHDTVNDLINRIEELVGGLLQGTDIRFSVECSSALKEIKLTPELRKELFLVLKEALHNAVKYSHCSAIALLIRPSGKRLIIELKDNGKGIDTTQSRNGHGLENMRKRTEFVGGVFSLDSVPGGGTTIRLDVPLSVRSYGTTRSGS
jgi:ligand-binding sensor domain-containing protein/signal transduction histidine kinase